MKVPQVGQRLFWLEIGGQVAARDWRQLTPVTVTKIGRVYFTCTRDDVGRNSEIQFRLDDWRQKGDFQDFCLYCSRLEHADEIEARELTHKLWTLFNEIPRRILPLSKMRAIMAIIEGSDNEQEVE